MFLKKLFSLLPQDPLARGLAYFNRGELDSAIGVFEGLLAHPEPEIQKKARLFACEAHIQLGDEASGKDGNRALLHYSAASELQPGFADVRNKLGETFQSQGEPEEAAQSFQAALDINPRYFVAKLNLCHALASSSQLELAAQELHSLQSISANCYLDPLKSLEADCRSARESDWDARFDEIRNIAPSQMEERRLAARSALQAGDMQRCLELSDEILVDEPSWPDIHLMRGIALGELNRSEEAIGAFEDALEIHPHYLKARINLGLSYLELERHEEARVALQRALETDPENALAHAALEEILSASVGG